MTESSSIYHPSFEVYNAEYTKQQQILQQNNNVTNEYFAYTGTSDVLAPHPDLFESELDSISADFGDETLELLPLENADSFSFLRSNTPTCGPPSTITASSESAYDTLSNYSESFYNHPHSPYASTQYSFPLDLEMDFQRIRVDPHARPDQYHTARPHIDGRNDPLSFGALPPTPPRSPAIRSQSRAFHKPYDRSAFSDYSPAKREYQYNMSSLAAHHQHQDRTPATPVPLVPSIPMLSAIDESKADPRKKYKCNQCPRGQSFAFLVPLILTDIHFFDLAFARAYNLKTHMATHDPNRLKPHVCPHRSCGRAFSRKHDLGRHLISIHRDESVHSAQSDGSRRSIGVASGHREWCDRCGKGLIGHAGVACDCKK
jgi:hypothetical protein